MSNPLYGMFNNQSPFNDLFRRFQQFQQTFRGDPQQQVQQLLNSGKISQAQYNQAVQMAQQFQKMLSNK